jgi:hypothetical protein
MPERSGLDVSEYLAVERRSPAASGAPPCRPQDLSNARPPSSEPAGRLVLVKGKVGKRSGNAPSEKTAIRKAIGRLRSSVALGHDPTTFARELFAVLDAADADARRTAAKGSYRPGSGHGGRLS